MLLQPGLAPQLAIEDNCASRVIHTRHTLEAGLVRGARCQSLIFSHTSGLGIYSNCARFAAGARNATCEPLDLPKHR